MVVHQIAVQQGLRHKLYMELVPEARKSGISRVNWLIITLVLMSFLSGAGDRADADGMARMAAGLRYLQCLCRHRIRD